MSDVQKRNVIVSFCFLTLFILIGFTFTNVRLSSELNKKADKNYVDKQDSLYFQGLWEQCDTIKERQLETIDLLKK